MRNTRRLLQLAERDFHHETAKPNLQLEDGGLVLYLAKNDQWFGLYIPEEFFDADVDELWAEAMQNFNS